MSTRSDAGGERGDPAFVLVHGSWHGGWAWQPVLRQLAARGYPACAPTLPGHGPDTARGGVTHAACVDAVVAEIRRRTLRDVVLVGHSFGGSVIQKVAERLPERIRRVIFVNAFVLADGERIVDNLPAEYVAAFERLAAESADGTMLLPWEIWRERFIQDAPEPVARALWELLSPEPHGVNLEPLELERFHALDLPSSVIVARQDRSLPPGSFYPRMASRLGRARVLELDGSHEVLFTRPGELADLLVAASAQPT